MSQIRSARTYVGCRQLLNINSKQTSGSKIWLGAIENFWYFEHLDTFQKRRSKHIWLNWSGAWVCVVHVMGQISSQFALYVGLLNNDSKLTSGNKLRPLGNGETFNVSKGIEDAFQTWWCKNNIWLWREAWIFWSSLRWVKSVNNALMYVSASSSMSTQNKLHARKHGTLSNERGCKTSDVQDGELNSRLSPHLLTSGSGCPFFQIGFWRTMDRSFARDQIWSDHGLPTWNTSMELSHTSLIASTQWKGETEPGWLCTKTATSNNWTSSGLCFITVRGKISTVNMHWSWITWRQDGHHCIQVTWLVGGRNLLITRSHSKEHVLVHVMEMSRVSVIAIRNNLVTVTVTRSICVNATVTEHKCAIVKLATECSRVPCNAAAVYVICMIFIVKGSNYASAAATKMQFVKWDGTTTFNQRCTPLTSVDCMKRCILRIHISKSICVMPLLWEYLCYCFLYSLKHQIKNSSNLNSLQAAEAINGSWWSIPYLRRQKHLSPLKCVMY